MLQICCQYLYQAREGERERASDIHHVLYNTYLVVQNNSWGQQYVDQKIQVGQQMLFADHCIYLVSRKQSRQGVLADQTSSRLKYLNSRRVLDRVEVLLTQPLLFIVW